MADEAQSQSQSRPNVAITGATGLVGASLAKYLADRGYGVTALARNREKAEALLSGSGARIETIPDIQDVGSLSERLRDIDVLVHAAGSVDPYGKRETIFAINVGGTRAALAAAARQGVKQFIHISSLSVITGQGDQYDVDESAPLTRCGEAYADSKVEAEELVMSEASAGEIEVTALRPGFIYGPGERAWLPRLINSISRGKAMLIDGGAKETNVIYVQNLNRAIEGAILNENAYGRVYNLTDGEKITKKVLFDTIADCLGLPRVKKKIPSVVAKPACEIISTIAPFLGPDKQRALARFSRAAFRLAGVNQGFSIARAETDLGYVDRIPFNEGMKETLSKEGQWVTTDAKPAASRV
ncbi:MAG: NAD-dependent epimerase/dehydratase family protein [Candidatus Melainabacteria bacterium]|nr:NAD-dependent epimerase/dehydratase family protein [Candidatus Melainabacteria bacterium]